jgi:hypothetical protein
VLRLTFAGGRWDRYGVFSLGPEVKDDPDAARLYRTYLGRVETEKLLDKMPRAPSAAFAGNAKCIECHPKAGEVWKQSKHAAALATLERDGHARDPDCVSCHVVGLESEKGFRSRAETPQLTDVGCESCHGPGLAHAIMPTLKMGIAGEKSCAKCHVPAHSPNFDFLTYWKRIAH